MIINVLFVFNFYEFQNNPFKCSFSLFRSLRGKSFKKWLSDIKMVLFNPMAVLLLLFYATASGYSAMIATKLEQLMCSQVLISYLLCYMTRLNQ